MVNEKIILTTILLTTMLAGTGAQFIIDMIQGLSTPMYKIFKITTEDLNLIYTAYSTLNLFFAPFGGYLILRYGIGNSAILFSTLVYLGILIGNFGAFYKKWSYFQLGWSIVGIGIESMVNTQVSACEKWFSGRFLSFSIGLKFAFSLMVGSFSGFICPELYLKNREIQSPFYYAALASFLGFLASAVLNLVDFKFEYLAKVNNDTVRKSVEIRLKEFENTKKYEFKVKDITKLNSVYWITILIYCFQFNVFSQYLHIMTDLSVKRFNYEYKEAKNFIAYYKFGVLITLPLVSFIIGKIGKKSLILAISSLICLISYISIYILPPNPSISYIMSLMGISLSYSMYTACIWPSMAVALPRSAVSFGYGVASSLQMVAGAIFPLFVGKLSEGRTVESYEKVLFFLCGLSILCIILSFMLVFVDLKKGKALWLPDNSPVVLAYRENLDRRFKRGGDGFQDEISEKSEFLTQSGTILDGSRKE